MNDLSSTVGKIYELHKNRGNAEKPRDYIGASIIGHECDRRLWLDMRGASKANADGRMHRLWDTGHREESRVIAELREVGCTVWDRDEAGNQFRYTQGYVSVGLDGVVSGLVEAKGPHVLEIKTANAKRFAELEKNGYAKWAPTYYAQVQVAMLLSEIDRAIVFVVCKDNDEIYSERIKLEPRRAMAWVERANKIAVGGLPDTKWQATYFACKMCPHYGLCHQGAMPAATCGTCRRGPRHCGACTDAELSEHVFIPALMPERMSREGNGWVAYQTFANCAATAMPQTDLPSFHSGALASMGTLERAQAVAEAVRVFPGSEVEVREWKP